MPLLADDGQADRLVDVPPHGPCLVVVPDPELLVVVELAPVRQLLGLDEDVAEELRAHCVGICKSRLPVNIQGDDRVKRPTMDAFWCALGDLGHDDLAFEGAEDDEAELG